MLDNQSKQLAAYQARLAGLECRLLTLRTEMHEEGTALALATGLMVAGTVSSQMLCIVACVVFAAFNILMTRDVLADLKRIKKERGTWDYGFCVLAVISTSTLIITTVAALKVVGLIQGFSICR